MIAYVLYWNEFNGSGVWAKVVAQVEAWSKMGETVEMHVLTSSDETISMPKDVALVQYSFHGLLGRISAWSRLANNVRKSAPTCVYFRYDVPSIAVLRLAKELSVVVEINTNDTAEFQRPLIKVLLNRVGRRILFKRIAGIVLVSHELKKMLPSSTFSKPVITIANAIDLERFTAKPPSENTRPAFLFVASQNHSWQGIDKVIQLAQYLPHSTFHIVGGIQVSPITHNTVQHGKLTSDQIGELATTCDIGIGTLALHRKGGSEACPLKVREYLALGLPTIIAYHDTDFPTPEDFILEIPNTEDCIEAALPQITAFANKWVGQRLPREKIVRIGSESKEALRLNFLKSVS